MRLARLVVLGLLLWLVADRAEAQIRSRPYLSGLTAPINIVQDPTDPNVQFVIEQAGRIRVVRNGVLGGDFLDIRATVLCWASAGCSGWPSRPMRPRPGGSS